MYYGGFNNGVQKRNELREKYGSLPKGQKEYMRNYALIQKWSNQGQKWGTNPRANIYFENKSIFSYGPHYMMAQFVVSKRDVVYALINSTDSSHTTECHKSLIRSIMRTCYPFYNVPIVNPQYEGDHKTNAEYLLSQANECLRIAKSRRFGNCRRTFAANDWNKLTLQSNNYRYCFGLPGITVPNADEVEDIKQEIEFPTVSVSSSSAVIWS